MLVVLYSQDDLTRSYTFERFLLMEETPILVIPEVAEILRLHPVTVSRMRRRGELPGFKLGAEWRVRRAELEAWMLEKQSKGKWRRVWPPGR